MGLLFPHFAVMKLIKLINFECIAKRLKENWVNLFMAANCKHVIL